MIPVLRLSAAVLVASMLLLGGCDTAGDMAEGVAHGDPIAAEIETVVGIRPLVWASDTRGFLYVGVTFRQVPLTALPSLEKTVREAVSHEFNNKRPNVLSISFNYEEGWGRSLLRASGPS